MTKNCSCYTGNWDKCLFPDSISIKKVQGFKDEPMWEIKECSFMQYIGLEFFPLSDFTRKEYEKFMTECCFCKHPMNK